MAKYFGEIGYGIHEEVKPGVWESNIVTRRYSGDVLRNSRRFSEGEGSTNDNVTINNEISIVADPFAYQNCQSIRYVEWMGQKWKVTSITVNRPRLILTVGGVYNGPET